MANGDNLPHGSLTVLPFDPITAQWANNLNANVLSLAAGSGLDDGAVTSDKVDFSTFGIASGSRAMNESTIQITGLGFMPNEVEFMFFPGTSTSAAYTSTGWSIRGGTHRSSATYSSTSASRRVSSAGFSILLTSNTATILQGFVSSFNNDGFTITMTSPGDAAHIFAWKARQ